MRKFLAIILAVCLVTATLPTQEIYASVVTVSGEKLNVELFVRNSCVSSVTTGPVLAEGEYMRWVDRIADLPDFAQEFYGWLEANTGADGALADPSLGQNFSGSRVYLVESVSGSVPFTYQRGESASDKAYEAAVADLGDLPYIIADYIFATYSAFDRDHPEVFWLTGASSCGSSISYSYSGSRNDAVSEYTLNLYFYLKTDDFDLRAPAYQDAETIATAIARRDADVDRILANLPCDAPTYEQVVYLNDALTTSNAYNSAVAEGWIGMADDTAWECVSALAGSSGVNGPVCEGYSRAFKVLCDRVGIPCVLTEGYGNGEAHMWNYVELGGSWYAVDVTFNDPVDERQLSEKVSGAEGNQWTGLGSDTVTQLGIPFSESHVLENVSYTGGLDYSNGPSLAADSYVQATHYMDISPYRTADGYTAPTLEGCVFAGWYADEALTVPVAQSQTTGWAYAKFVDEEVLTLKFQTTNGTNADSAATDLRLLTSVESLSLRQVSFRVQVGGAEQTLFSSTVYEKIRSGDALISNPATIFSDDSAYFVTYTLLEIPQSLFGISFTVVPCWQTLDGTVVEGLSRSFSISQTY